MQIRGAGREGTEAALLHLEVLRQHIQARPDRMAERTRRESLDHALAAFAACRSGRRTVDQVATATLVERVLDVDDQAAGRAQRRADPVDVRHDLAGGGDLGHLAGRHEAVLQIDHDMSGALGNEAVEHAEAAAALGARCDDIRVDGRLVHDLPRFARILAMVRRSIVTWGFDGMQMPIF